MWSDLIRIFISIFLLIAFVLLFGEKSITRFMEGGIAKIRDEEEMTIYDLPNPGDTFFSSLKEIYSVLEAITIADTSNVVESIKVCRGTLDIEGCIENDKSKILETDPSSQSVYVDFYRKVYRDEYFLTYVKV